MTTNENVHRILGTIKVITIARNIVKQNIFRENFRNLTFEFVVDMDMTVMYTEYPFVKDIPEEIFIDYDFDKDYCSRWSKGQFGCFATEKRILKDFHREGSGNLTILLDDAVPNFNWESNLQLSYSELPNDWDILILGTRLGKETHRLLRPIIHHWRDIKNVINKKKFSKTRTFSGHLDNPTGKLNGVFGVIYSPKGLSKIINEPNKLRKDQDDVLISRLIHSKYIKAYICYPQVVKEGEFGESWTQKNNFI